MREAFTYMFKDNKISQKAGIYLVFLLISTLCSKIAQLYVNQPEKSVVLAIIFAIIGGLFGLVISGYSIACNRAILEQKENIVLPFINVGTNIFTGFKFGVSIFLLLLVSTVIMIPFAILSTVVSPIFITLYTIAFCIFLLCYVLAFTYIFVTTDSWTSFLKLPSAAKLFGKWQYWKSVLLIIGLSLLNWIISYLLSFLGGLGIIGVIIAISIMSLVSAYLVYVYAYIVANCATVEVQPAEAQ